MESIMVVHWGFFNKGLHVGTCLAISEQAMRDDGLQIFDGSRNGFVIIGGIGELIVTTVCEPQGNGSARIAVIATSTDSSRAEWARNRIRERIVNTVMIDEGTALNPV
jgi:hypothetical protein